LSASPSRTELVKKESWLKVELHTDDREQFIGLSLMALIIAGSGCEVDEVTSDVDMMVRTEVSLGTSTHLVPAISLLSVIESKEL